MRWPGPDGALPLLNDAWEGPAIREPPAEEPLTQLADSGYVVFRHGDDQAVFDVGPLCPPHLPPHGHADALSFVLWGDGRPVVVDPGVGAYTGPLRNRFRATAAHNTVEVDGASQCVLWGDFRLARLPTVRAALPRKHAGGVVTVAARHDGYRRLDDPVDPSAAVRLVAGSRGRGRRPPAGEARASGARAAALGTRDRAE